MSSALLDLLAPGRRAQWQRWTFSEQLSQLRRHRLLPLALNRLSDASDFERALRESVASEGRRLARADDELLHRTLGLLAAAGCRALLLKGAALGRWLYAAPELRPATDLDLLVAPADRLRAHAALAEAGFHCDGYSQHDLASNQAVYLDRVSGRQVDLHWSISVVPELACAFEFSRLERSAQTLPGPSGARSLGRVDTLLHAVVHLRAHQPADTRPAIWWYDIAQLARSLGEADWQSLDREARRCELAGLLEASLTEADEWFGCSPPGDLMQAWRETGAHERTRHWRQSCAVGPARRLWRSLSALPNLRARYEYLRARLVPDPAWMRGRYQVAGTAQLLLAYGRRWCTGLMSMGAR